MLRRVDELKTFTVHATDGEVGSLAGLLFNPLWAVAYAVVDIGAVQPDRRVLIPTGALWQPESAEILLTMNSDQVRKAADADSVDATGRTPSPVHHAVVARHQGYFGEIGSVQGPNIEPAALSDGDRLFGTDVVIGFSVQAEGTTAGRIEDLLVDDEDWRIPFAIIHLTGRAVPADVLVAAGNLRLNTRECRAEVTMPVRELEMLEIYDPVRLVDREAHQR